MADTLPVTDPTATSNAGINISDSNEYTAIVSGTGVTCAWDGTGGFLLKNGSSGERIFTFTIPIPSGSGLAAVGSTPSSTTYTVALGETQYVANADAFRDPTDGSLTFDVNGADCSAIAIGL